MKAWIAWGALAIAVVAVAARPSASEAHLREHRIEVPVRVEVPVEVPKIVEKERIDTRDSERVSRPPVPVSKLRPLEGTALAQEKMLFLFERQLDLRAEQRRHMVEVLANRNLQIVELQKSIVVSGVFRPREYDAQVKAMQAASYVKMAEVLDESQCIRWKALIAEGRLGDAVQFEVPPTLVVLQD